MDARWPEVSESAHDQDSMMSVLQVNVKLRSKIDVSRDITRDELEKLALEDEIIQRFVSEGSVRKVIVVPGKLVNIVIG
jgi:leucyl-tRNA synthetase